MARPPRPRNEGVIRVPDAGAGVAFPRAMVAALQMAGFFYVLLKAGWHPGAPVDVGAPLHHAYQQATTMTFLGMIAGQIGTAFAVRTQRASLWSVGVFSNRFLLAGIAAEIVLAAVFVYVPPLQALLGTAALPAADLLLLLPYPFIVGAPTSYGASCGGAPTRGGSSTRQPHSRAKSTSQPIESTSQP